VARPTDSSQPRLAAGCRWSNNGDEKVILFPEGAIRVQGTGSKILEHCDGRQTFRDIVEELQKHYTASDPARIRDDVAKFLEALQQKRIVDY
jgi:pyrroloquinoline quinone biosynthesis protein D